MTEAAKKTQEMFNHLTQVWRDQPAEVKLAAACFYLGVTTLEMLRTDPNITREQAEFIINHR